ncbi:MAG: energy-coupling factor transporter transmembrane protein EcfT [Anaerolineae bacterium]|nr:energy-coupling factor transporter transmembrane protein EcfT [Anaerolineae bacterium]
MNLLLPGMYVAADSPLHRLDPRLKMGAALGLMALPFAVHSLLSCLLLVALVAAMALLAQAPITALLRTVRTVFWLALLMFIFYFFATPGQPLVTWGGVSVTVEGLAMGATQVYRICLLVIVASLLTYTTSPGQLAHGLEALFGPLERLRFPVREIALVLTIALRFVPTFFAEIDAISKAQRARGADFYSGGPWRRLRSLVPIFVPIFVSALRRAEDLATAMDARGFRCAPHRTRLYRLSLGWNDLAASLIVLAASLLILGLERWI